MIKLENTVLPSSEQWEAIIRGMRNPMNSWDKSDSMKCIDSCDDCANFSICNNNDAPYFKLFWEGGPHDTDFCIGPNDLKLMKSLAKAGSDHAKYRRMIVVYVDITAPLYWWKEFDTYKVGTVANSCSTMHKIHEKEFELDDFSRERLDGSHVCASVGEETFSSWDILYLTVKALNYHRKKFLETGEKEHWENMIQLLPSSYNQRRTVLLNYEVLANMYRSRKNHKLREWHVFCEWIKGLPYSELITGEEE